MGISLYKQGEKVEDLHVFTYSDSIPAVKSQDFSKVYKADTMVITGNSLTEFFAAMALMDGAFRSSISTLVLPFIPGARQDRVNPTGDILPTLQYVSKLINKAGFDRVLVLDPHSLAFSQINNAEAYDLAKIYLPTDNCYDGVISPDKGSIQRALDHAENLGVPIYFGNKVRDVSTGVITEISVEVPSGLHLLIVDDICDGGGTFIPLAEQIKQQGSTADLYVTHGLFSRGTDQLKHCFEKIYTTDSLSLTKNAQEHVIVIPVVQDLIRYAAGINE